jgi:L-seryl-tRNA(Ser) seleniumtransferase
LRVTEDELRRRAAHIAEELRTGSSQLEVEVMESRSVLGGGSAPGTALPSQALAVKKCDISADDILQRLRQWDPPIIARIEEDRVVLDLRTVEPEQDVNVLAALQSLRRN